MIIVILIRTTRRYIIVIIIICLPELLVPLKVHFVIFFSVRTCRTIKPDIFHTTIN